MLVSKAKWDSTFSNNEDRCGSEVLMMELPKRDGDMTAQLEEAAAAGEILRYTCESSEAFVNHTTISYATEV